MEDFDGEEIDEEALIEQRRQQRMAIVQVCSPLCWNRSHLFWICYSSPVLEMSSRK